MNSTQNWTDDNVAKLVRQKQKEELESYILSIKNIRNKLFNAGMGIKCIHDELIEMERRFKERIAVLEERKYKLIEDYFKKVEE